MLSGAAERAALWRSWPKQSLPVHGALISTDQTGGIHGTNERLGVESLKKPFALPPGARKWRLNGSVS